MPRTLFGTLVGTLWGTLFAAALGLLTTLAAAHPPAITAPEPFASGLAGPEGLAFGKDGSLYVGTVTGEIRRVAPDGTHAFVGSVGTDRVAGVSVLRDGRILACAFGANRVWSVDPLSGAASVYANVQSPNFVVQTRSGRVLTSSSFGLSIVDITGGGNTVVASGFSFPNGLALRQGKLYVADTLLGQVLRLPVTKTGPLGPAEVYASGLLLADGIAFDTHGNLYVVGADTLSVVDPKTRLVTPISTDPLLEWPSNLAFGTSNAYGRRFMYLVNFGPGLGDGTTVVRIPDNHRGAKLIR